MQAKLTVRRAFMSSGGGGVLSKPATVADLSYNRWQMVLPAVATHLSIGGLYAWSMLNEPLSRTLGVVASAPGDWGLASIVPVFSTAVCAAGGTAALCGTWNDKVGPRTAVFLAGTLWGGGMMLGGLGVALHQLPLVYLGYGLIGGAGIGFAYTPPVATLLRWFPDKKGLASGMVIMGFGSGALVALPVLKHLTERNFVAPEYFGLDAATLLGEGGVRVLASNPLQQVVVATQSDITKLGLTNTLLEPGVYALGGGNTGIATALMTIGAAYTAVMCLAAINYKVPHPDWIAPAAPVPKQTTTTATATTANSLVLPAGSYVLASEAVRTRQFAQVWTSLFLNATAGIAVLGVAKTLMSDVFGSSMPTTVDAAFCAAFVGGLSLFNGVGRLVWAGASDRFGRKTVYATFFALGAPLYLSVPFCAHLAGTSDSVLPLVMFTASTLTIISMYGGAFSVGPAYLADLFGNKQVGNIYGKLLTAWSAAGLVGPTLLATLRRQSEVAAIRDIAGQVDPARFQAQFGAPVSDLDALLAANSVSINRLMEIAGSGVVDPTPFLYDTTMQTMSALLVLGFVNNFMMRPVDGKLVLKETNAK